MSIDPSFDFKCDWCGHEDHQKKTDFHPGWVIFGSRYILSFHDIAGESRPSFVERFVLCPKCSKILTHYIDIVLNHNKDKKRNEFDIFARGEGC